MERKYYKTTFYIDANSPIGAFFFGKKTNDITAFIYEENGEFYEFYTRMKLTPWRCWDSYLDCFCWDDLTHIDASKFASGIKVQNMKYDEAYIRDAISQRILGWRAEQKREEQERQAKEHAAQRANDAAESWIDSQLKK